MPAADWRILCPDNIVWTPAEIAQIARAAQALREALPNSTKRLHHLVHLDGICVLSNDHEVTWPQPVDPELVKKLEESVQMYKAGLMSIEEVRRQLGGDP